VHAHSTALHQAAGDNDVALIKLLLAHGAQRDRRDTLWEGTPLDWAMYGHRAEAEAVLRD
jgi:peptide-methionine (S)-S-oxide reductase